LLLDIEGIIIYHSSPYEGKPHADPSAPAFSIPKTKDLSSATLSTSIIDTNKMSKDGALIGKDTQMAIRILKDFFKERCFLIKMI